MITARDSCAPAAPALLAAARGPVGVVPTASLWPAAKRGREMGEGETQHTDAITG